MLFPYLIVDVYLSCVLVSCVLLFVLYVYLTVRVEPYAAPAAVQYLVLVCVGTQCVPGVATCVVAKIYRPMFSFFVERRPPPCLAALGLGAAQSQVWDDVK